MPPPDNGTQARLDQHRRELDELKPIRENWSGLREQVRNNRQDIEEMKREYGKRLNNIYRLLWALVILLLVGALSVIGTIVATQAGAGG